MAESHEYEGVLTSQQHRSVPWHKDEFHSDKNVNNDLLEYFKRVQKSIFRSQLACLQITVIVKVRMFLTMGHYSV
jgi:hypothetical protein